MPIKARSLGVNSIDDQGIYGRLGGQHAINGIVEKSFSHAAACVIAINGKPPDEYSRYKWIMWKAAGKLRGQFTRWNA